MKNILFAIQLMTSAALFVHAGPILTLPSHQDPIELDFQEVGDFQLQQTGNQITGNYSLTQTEDTHSFFVINPSDQQIMGEFQLQESDQSGTFLVEQTTNQSLYVLVESGNETIGTYLQEQGNQITGNYKLAVQAPSAPEPASFVLSTAGIGCLALGRLLHRKRRNYLNH